MEESNYSTWAYEIRLWLKIDAQLGSVIKFTLHTSHKPIFCTDETCALVRSEARTLCTNDTKLYGMCQDLLTPSAP